MFQSLGTEHFRDSFMYVISPNTDSEYLKFVRHNFTILCNNFICNFS
jgi:hypothetical protein